MTLPSVPVHAAMPSLEEIARVICASDFDYDWTVYDTMSSAQRLNFAINARAVMTLFAPILAEKERLSMRRWTAALSQAQEWRNVAEKAESRALAAEAALAGLKQAVLDAEVQCDDDDKAQVRLDRLAADIRALADSTTPPRSGR